MAGRSTTNGERAGGIADVTVVLPTRDRPAMALDAARSVLRCVPAPAELLIVEQSEEPRAWNVDLESNGRTRVRVHRSRERGLSRAVNTAVALASHDLVLVIHDDVLAGPGWVGAMSEASGQFGPSTLLTGRIVQGRPEAPGNFAPALAAGVTPAIYRDPRWFDMLKPLNIAFTRGLFEATGGFDDRLGPGTSFPAAEDADFGYRLLQADHAIAFVPDACVVHRAWRGSGTWARLRWHYGYGRGGFYAKHITADDHRLVRHFVDDVWRRLSRFPRRLVREPARAIGDPAFVTGCLAGALHWTIRERRAACRSTASASATGHRAPIPVLTGLDARDRPRWSVMIPTHNCASYLERTLRSVLAAIDDRHDVQIEVVDDCSTEDDPQEVVRRLGDPRIEFFRQLRNVGHTANFDTCLRRSRGHLVHLLHGDDMVRPGFYSAMERTFDEHPEIGAAFCRYDCIDEHDQVLSTYHALRPEAGVLAGWLEEIAAGNRLQAASITARREVYEALGGFDSRIPSYGEDWEMWVRIASRYAVHYDPRPLAAYRLRESSLTSTASPARNIEQLRLVAELNRAVLPPDRGAALARRANINAAAGSLRRAVRAFDAGDRRLAVAYVRASLLRPVPLPVLGRLSEAAARVTVRVVRRSTTRVFERVAPFRSAA